MRKVIFGVLVIFAGLLSLLIAWGFISLALLDFKFWEWNPLLRVFASIMALGLWLLITSQLAEIDIFEIE